MHQVRLIDSARDYTYLHFQVNPLINDTDKQILWCDHSFESSLQNDSSEPQTAVFDRKRGKTIENDALMVILTFTKNKTYATNKIDPDQ